MLTPEEMAQKAEPFDPDHHDYPGASTERRQQMLQRKHNEKQTDALPSYLPVTTTAPIPALSSAANVVPTQASESPSALTSPESSSHHSRMAWRQVVYLREENRRLHAEIKSLQEQNKVAEEQRGQSVLDEREAQPVADSVSDLQSVIDERDVFLREYQEIKQRYEALSQRFEQAVAEEAQTRLHSFTAGMAIPQGASSIEETAPWLRQMISAAKAQHSDDHQWNEALFLKRELQRVVTQVESERAQLDADRQQVAALQASIREQAFQREHFIDARLRARWRVISILTSLGLLAFLLILQFVCMAVFHVNASGMLKLALIIPIVVCALLALVLSQPVDFLRQLHLNAPHRVK